MLDRITEWTFIGIAAWAVYGAISIMMDLNNMDLTRIFHM